jgi:hypothetical protein
MTAIAAAPEPLLTNQVRFDCVYTFAHTPVLSHFKCEAHVYPDELKSLHFASSHSVPAPVINLLSLPVTTAHLFIWNVGVSWTRHVELLKLWF